MLAFLGGGYAKVAVPTWARIPRSTAIGPVLDKLTGLLGPQFETLGNWTGQHELLGTADPTKWHQKHWTDAIGMAVML